jgi:uncharacterized iron-regulated membrane protein
MIASGLVLYTVKQRRQARSAGQLRFLRSVEALNVAVVAGLALACVALLWSNRILPVELASRADWELRLFFAFWLLCLLHAALRAPFKAWREQLGAAALLALGLPLLDLWSAGGALDDLRLGVDVSAAGLGLLFGWAAWRIAPAQARDGLQPAVAVEVAQ